MDPNQISQLPFETRLAMFESAARNAGYRSRDVSALTSLIQQQEQSRLRTELVEEGVLDLADVAQTNPRAALQLAQQGFKPGQAATADERKKIAKEQDVARKVNLLEKNLEQIKGRGPVLGPFLLGGAAGTGGFLAPETADYEALRKALIGPLARVISGEVGVLTDRDIKRAERLLPKVTDTPKLQRMKLDNIRAALGTGSSSFEDEDPLKLGL